MPVPGLQFGLWHPGPGTANMTRPDKILRYGLMSSCAAQHLPLYSHTVGVVFLVQTAEYSSRAEW